MKTKKSKKHVKKNLIKKEFKIVLKKECDDWRCAKYLGNPNLFSLITEQELSKKIVGEGKSIKAIFLSLCSIWLKDSEVPLNSLISSESSAGKSFICKNVVKLFPPELVVYRTKITPEAFTYLKANEEDWTWDGKIFYLEDVGQSILDAPTFKVMCSEGSVATIVNKQKAVDIKIKGKPVMLVTTARTNPNIEILNRFQIIPLDESEQQTEDIVFSIAEGKSGESYSPFLMESFRKLERESVTISYAKNIATFLKQNFDFKSLRLRRDFSRLLDLIKCSTTLHQFQREREKNTGKLVAIEQDYEIARGVIDYIQSGTFRGLTHRLKKAFDCCMELKNFTAKEIYSKFPFVNQKMWYIYLDNLLERKMLSSELGWTDGVKQKVIIYSIKNNQSFSLPEFSYLSKNITKVTKVTNDTKVTKVTNDNIKKERTIVTFVTNVVKKTKKKPKSSHNLTKKDKKKPKIPDFTAKEIKKNGDLDDK